MTIEEWEQWLVRLLVSEGIFNVLREETIREQAGQHYDLNLDYAIGSLMDRGIITQLHSEGQKRYAINHDRIEDAKKIAHREIPKEKVQVAQPYCPEPTGFDYWFDHEERRSFRKQNKYRIFKNKNSKSFVGQLLGKSMVTPTNYHTGSLDNPDSYISRLVNAMHELSKEKEDGIFILQDLQDKDRLATGNNRQRGKVILSVCEKLGIIEFVEMKGNSVGYRLHTDTKPPNKITLDDFNPPNAEELSTFSDPEWFEEDESVHKSIEGKDTDMESKPA